MIKAIQEKLLFLYTFSRAPKAVGSVTPSSAFLAGKMIDSVPWDRVEHVAELGAGTGAITKQLERAAGKDTNVLLFEKDDLLRSRLAERYPGYACYDDAGKLQQALRDRGIERLDCVLSGLPFFNFPQSARDHLVNEIAGSLKPGGLFVAFQYSQQMRNQLDLHFDVEHVHFVPMNIPPAFVYVCRKR